MTGNAIERIARHLRDVVGERNEFRVAAVLSAVELDPEKDMRRLRDLRAFGWVITAARRDSSVTPGHYRLDKVGLIPGTDGVPRSGQAVRRSDPTAEVDLDSLSPGERRDLALLIRSGGATLPRAVVAYLQYQRLSRSCQAEVKVALFDTLTTIERRRTRMKVTVSLGGGKVVIGHVEIDAGEDADEVAADAQMGDDDSTLRAAAVAWNALTRNAVFTVNGVQHEASECAEWWA